MIIKKRYVLSRKISRETEGRDLKDDLENLICQLGPKSLPLIPKEFLGKSKRYILTDVLSHMPIEVCENFIRVLTEDKDIDLDAIADLSTEPQKSTLSFTDSQLERKYPAPIQWKYVSKCQSSRFKYIYHFVILSLQDNSDHIIL